MSVFNVTRPLTVFVTKGGFLSSPARKNKWGIKHVDVDGVNCQKGNPCAHNVAIHFGEKTVVPAKFSRGDTILAVCRELKVELGDGGEEHFSVYEKKLTEKVSESARQVLDEMKAEWGVSKEKKASPAKKKKPNSEKSKTYRGIEKSNASLGVTPPGPKKKVAKSTKVDGEGAVSTKKK